MVFFIDITWLLTKKCIMKVKTIALNIFARNKNEWNRSNNLQLDYFVESYHIPDYWWKVSCFKNHCIFFNTIKQGWHGFFPRFSCVSLTLTDIIKDNISASSKSDGIEISFDLEEVGTCWNICLIQISLQFFLWEMTSKKHWYLLLYFIFKILIFLPKPKPAYQKALRNWNVLYAVLQIHYIHYFFQNFT